jgi:hypothetical protein
MTTKYSYPIEASTINGWVYPVSTSGDPDSSNPERIHGDSDLYLYFGSSGGADGCLFANTEKRDVLTTADVKRATVLAQAVCDLGTLAADVADTGRTVSELLGTGAEALPDELVSLITEAGREAQRILDTIQG